MTQEDPISSVGTNDVVASKHETDSEVMVLCPTCSGHGQIFLEYRDKNSNDNEDQAERWLPCGDCEGAGIIPEGEVPDHQKIDRTPRLHRILYEIYRVAVEVILRN